MKNISLANKTSGTGNGEYYIKIDIKRLTDIFRNVFYCGFVTSKLLNGGVVKGRHEPIISEEIFISVNSCKIKYNTTDYITKQDSQYPLKGLIICSKCSTKWTAYSAKRKKIDYYKCNTRGCKCNRNATQLHNEFVNLLKGFKIPTVLEAPLRSQLKLVFAVKNKDKAKEKESLQIKINDIKERIGIAKTNFATNKIPEDVYNVSLDKLSAEEYEVTKGLNEAKVYLSNYKDFIDFSINLSRNLDQIWVSADTRLKKMFQKMIFPLGIEYDNESNTYRTKEVNGIFNIFSSISSAYKTKEEEQPCNPSSYSGLVEAGRRKSNFIKGLKHIENFLQVNKLR